MTKKYKPDYKVLVEDLNRRVNPSHRFIEASIKDDRLAEFIISYVKDMRELITIKNSIKHLKDIDHD